MFERRRVQIVQQRSATRMRDPVVDIHVNVVHARQIEHQAAFTNRFAGPAMATTAYGEQQVIVTCKRHGQAEVVYLVTKSVLRTVGDFEYACRGSGILRNYLPYFCGRCFRIEKHLANFVHRTRQHGKRVDIP